MSAGWMVYATCVGLLLTCAAILLEASPWGRARGARFIWIAMLAMALLWPVTVAVLGRANPGRTTQRGAESSLPALPNGQSAPVAAAPLLSPAVALPAVVPGSPLLDRLALRVAVVTPLLVLALLVVELIRIGRARRRWERRVVDGISVLVSVDFGPAIIGVLSPQIVVPAWALALPPDERTLLLAHESEHLASHDSRWLSAAYMAVLIAPWNVGLWWLVRRFRLAMEVECDRRVLLRGHDLERYGNLLVEIGRRATGRSLLATGFAERRSMLRTRIISMTSAAGRTWGWGVWRVGAGAVLVLGACMLGPSKEDASIRFTLAPYVADSMAKAKGTLGQIVGAAHDLPAAFRVEIAIGRTADSNGKRCPEQLMDDRDGTMLKREAEEHFFEPLAQGVSWKDVPARTVKQVVGYYSIRPVGRYGVDSTHWLRVGCLLSPRSPNNAASAVPDTQPAGEVGTKAMSDANLILGRFAEPRDGKPSIVSRFTHDTVRVGEAVALLTVTWLPKDLLQSLRHLPVLTAPSIAGLPSTAVELPRTWERRHFGERLYDMYYSVRPIPTHSSGRLEASPAVLTYEQPALATFAPEDRIIVRSLPAVLVIRPKN